MKVLLVHNWYRGSIPSGENRVVETELEALRVAGVDARSFFRSSDEFETMSVLGKARASIAPITGSSNSEFKAILREWGPDVVHLHNPYPLISPRVVDIAMQVGVPLVATIHNFRLQCMNGLLFRDGHICTDCEGRSLGIPGVLHSCYRGSMSQSAIMATAIGLHHKRWDGVSRFIAVSEFVAERLASWGVEKGRIAVKPNPVSDPQSTTPPQRGFLFAGRLSEEKGVTLLLDSWAQSGLDGAEELLIAGGGPLFEQVKRRASQFRSVNVLGVLDAAGVDRVRRRTAVGITCSLCFEAHPAVGESFAHGRPVIATDIGALGSIVDDSVGWLVEPTIEGLSAGLVAACDRESIAKRGASARTRYERDYRPEVVVANLIAIYEGVVTRR